MLALTILEHVEYPAGSKLSDIAGPDVSIAGAVRKIGCGGNTIRQVAIVGTPPDLYFPPA
ncbi:MAG TPA: hypothetical protein VHX65_01535 [Pirellulales bacterium]|nr:hypothetical protein [Pirellulales bacterium]